MVDENDRFPVIPEILQVEDFDDFLEGSQPAWQSNEGISLLIHDGFAVTQILRDDQFIASRIASSKLMEFSGNNAIDVSSGILDRVRKLSHQTRDVSSVDKGVTVFAYSSAEFHRQLDVVRLNCIAGGKEDADIQDIDPFRIPQTGARTMLSCRSAVHRHHSHWR